jgi:hypothetical protein
MESHILHHLISHIGQGAPLYVLQRLFGQDSSERTHDGVRRIVDLENSETGACNKIATVPGIHRRDLCRSSARLHEKLCGSEVSMLEEELITDLFLLSGIDLAEFYQQQLLSPLACAHLTAFEVAETERTVQIPVRFVRSFDLRPE